MKKLTLPEDGSPPMEFALSYAEAGVPVIPLAHISSVPHGQCGCRRGTQCDAVGKHPRLRTWREQATTDPSTIRQWWGSKPTSGVGVVTGAPSSLLVLDVDPRNGGGESLFELQMEYGLLPDTWEVLTGGGGWHVYFAVRSGSVRSRKLASGLDLQGDGKFVVAPPSLHKSGTPYCWELSGRPDEVEIADAPDWLLTDGGLSRHPMPTSRPVSEALDGVCEGERNDALFKLASRYRGKGLTDDETRLLVSTAGSNCTPPLPDKEIESVLASVSRYPMGDGDADTHQAPRWPIVHGSAIRDLPTPEYLIEGVLFCDSQALLFGRPGAGKSFLAHDIGLHIAAGISWHGRTTKKGKVLYILAEGVGDVGLRNEAWCEHHGIGDVEDISYLLGAVNLFHGDAHLLLVEIERLGRTYDLVIVDTLARSMAGGDENSAKDMGLLIEGADRLRRELGATVLLVHHPGKDGRNERGSSALLGAVDTEMKLDKGKLTCEKQKYAAPFEPMAFTLEPSAESVVVVPVGGWGGTNDNDLIGSSVLADVELTHGEWKAACIAEGMAEGSFKNVVKRLLKKGVVERLGEGKGARYRCTAGAGSHVGSA